MTDQAARTLTLDEAARVLGLTRKAVEARVSRGTLQSVLRDGRRLVLADEVMRAAAAEADQPAPSAADRDALVERYAEARYQVGVRDGRDEARAQLTEGHERRQRELQDQVVELSAQLKAAEAVVAVQQERLDAPRKGFFRRRRTKDTETDAL